MIKFSNPETQLMDKWFGNIVDCLVVDNKHMNNTELISLVSETIENDVKREILVLTEGYISDIIHKSFILVDYAEWIRHYQD